MAVPVLDTPRTEVADQTRLTTMDDLNFSIEDSVPSPSKEGHNLLMQIQNMRGKDINTPRASRLPLNERRNVPSKAEFTPLLKSATRNSFVRSSGYDKENQQIPTPAALRASYRADSPGLPFNSSVIIEEHTGSSVGPDDGHRTPMAPVSSSSVLSTPMAILHNRGDGPLNGGGNLATLREQEARLEQIDKENFSLKLKIHFLEEALKRRGTEFNEAAVKENTELKVDKVTLQRDLKNYRKSLAQAERDLEDYKRQLLDYAEKMKRRHASETSQEELDRLRQAIAEKDSYITALEAKIEAAGDQDERVQDERIQELQDEISDLQAEMRQKDLEIDGKDDELDELKKQLSRPADTNFEQQLEEKDRLLDEKDEDIESLRGALENIEAESQRKLKERDQLLEAKDEELQQLEENLKASGQDQSFARKEVAKAADEKNSQLQSLKERLNEEAAQNKDIVEGLQEQLRSVESNLGGEIRKKSRMLEEKDFEIHSLTQKLETSKSEQLKSKDYSDEVQDLQAEGREKDRIIEEKDDELDDIRQQLQEAAGLDDELMEAKDRIHELELKEVQHLKDLQALRDSGREPAGGDSSALERARERILELEAQQQFSRKHERQLEEDVNQLRSNLKTTEAESSSKGDQVSSTKQSLDIANSELEKEKAQAAANRQSWEETRSALEAQNGKAQEKIKNLEQDIFDLQKVGASSSGLETQLRNMLENEKKRHQNEEDSLKGELDSVKADAKVHLESLETARLEVEQAQRELMNTRDDADILHEKIESLEDEVEILQTGFEEADQVREDLLVAKHRIEVLEEQVQSINSATPRQTLQKQISDLKLTISQMEKEKQSMRDSVLISNSEQENLRNVLSEAEAARDTAQQQYRDLRTQLQNQARDRDLKQQSQLKAYEQDIQSLENDLAQAQSKQTDLTHAKEDAERQISQLRSKNQSLEARLGPKDNQGTSAQERQDLHEMLKDAKLETEDLALQVRERDSRITTAVAKEGELRAQLKRIREERAAQSSRADNATKEADQLQRKYDHVVEDLAALQRKQKVRFPQDSSSGADEKKEKRHTAELKGLIKQIEYLAARCRREESFRRDLSYVKTFFTQQVEMYGRCTAADIRLVRAMGIPTEVIRKDELRKEREKRTQGRDAHLFNGRAPVHTDESNGDRPSLKVVALTVLASVRMQRAAQKWAEVKKSHEGLLKKLNSMRRTPANSGKHLSLEPKQTKGSKAQ